MPIRFKKCKVCGEKFIPVKPLQSVCGWACGLIHGKKLALKKKRKIYLEEKTKLRTRSDYIKSAQTAFNAFIRERDAQQSLPCISCGRHHQGQWHAGHYRPTTQSALRFTEDNVWRQCSSCNCYKHGNLTLYRASLINKIGLARVEELESNHDEAKWTIEELKEIERTYKAKLKGLKNANPEKNNNLDIPLDVIFSRGGGVGLIDANIDPDISVG